MIHQGGRYVVQYWLMRSNLEFLEKFYLLFMKMKIRKIPIFLALSIAVCTCDANNDRLMTLKTEMQRWFQNTLHHWDKNELLCNYPAPRLRVRLQNNTPLLMRPANWKLGILVLAAECILQDQEVIPKGTESGDDWVEVGKVQKMACPTCGW